MKQFHLIAQNSKILPGRRIKLCLRENIFTYFWPKIFGLFLLWVQDNPLCLYPNFLCEGLTFGHTLSFSAHYIWSFTPVETLFIFPYLEIEKKQDWKIISVALENVGYTSIFCANGGMEECFKVKEVSATCCMCCFPFCLPPPPPILWRNYFVNYLRN